MRSWNLPLAGLTAVVLMALVGLHGGWASVGTGVPGGFHTGHIWALDTVTQMLTGDHPWSAWTERAGAPEFAHLRFIAWVPLLVGAPLAAVLGTVPAYHLVVLLGLVASAWVMALLVERVVSPGWGVSAAVAMIYVLGPYALGCLANGQLAKIQLWCLPLCLLAVDGLLRRPGKAMGFVCVALAVLATGLTAPSIGLVLPAALLPWLVFRIDPEDGQRWVWVAVALGAVALGLVGPWMYYSLPVDGTEAFSPASPIAGLVQPSWLSPTARPATLLWGAGPWDTQPDAINNVGALGIPALLGVLVVGRRRFEGRSLALALVGLGAILALGPSVDAGGLRWVLPARVLEWVNYPLARSGMYYRFVQVGALGAALAVAGGLAGWRTRGARLAVAWVVGLLALADGVRATASIWPRDLRPIRGHTALAEMATDPVQGAVLDLPLAHLDTEGTRMLLASTVHGRKTTALSRNIVVRGHPRLERLDAMVRASDARRQLSAAGFAYVVLRRAQTPDGRRMQETLTASLGTPQLAEGLRIWRLDD